MQNLGRLALLCHFGPELATIRMMPAV